MDFVTHFPRTVQKHDAVWVIVDRLTKSTHFLVVAPFSGPTRLADPNQFRDASLILFIYFLFIYFFSKVSRPESPAQPDGGSEPEPSLLRAFSFILSKTFLFMSFQFRVFNYAEAVSNGMSINNYFYTIRLQNDVFCLYKMIYKTIVQRLTLLFTKCHTLKKNGMHMTGYIFICRNLLYDSALLDIVFFPVYSKPMHR